MENQDPSIEDCKRYMHMEMSDEEKQAFEQRIKADPGFKERAQRNVKALEALGREEIRRQALEGYDAEEVEERRKKNDRYRLGGIAAAILLLISLGVYAFMPTDSDMEALYQEHYKFFIVGTRSDDVGEDSLWNVALDYYETEGRQDFKRAEEEFERLLADSAFEARHGNEAWLYLGISRLELGNGKGAISAFEEVKSEAAGYYGDAVWYSALARLKMGDRAGAQVAFLGIMENPRWPKTRRDKAEEIYERLEEDAP